jgi:hypothetical protein
VHDRNLARAGLRSQAGRGNSAARVTPRDAANLLVAVLGSNRGEDSVRTVQRYKITRPYLPTSSPRLFQGSRIRELIQLPTDHNFVDAVEAIIAAGARAHLLRALRHRGSPLASKLQVGASTSTSHGEIRFLSDTRSSPIVVRYHRPEGIKRTRDEVEILIPDSLNDLRQSRFVTALTLFQIGKLLDPHPELYDQ